jgi:hypothetical protein
MPWFNSFWRWLRDGWPIALVVTSLFILIVAAALAYISSARFTEQRQRDKKKAGKDPRRLSRLDEVEAEIKRHDLIVTLNNALAVIAMVGQYIVGAALGATFFQHDVDPKVTGLLGVWVLVSTAISRNYRPALRGSQAKVRRAAYESLRRSIEDQIKSFVGALAPEDIDALNEIGRKIGRKLDDLDRLELADDRALAPAEDRDG